MPRLSPEQQELAEAQIQSASKKTEFTISDWTIEVISKKMEKGLFEIPRYQREFTWEPDRQSKFIESILMNLPIPFVFFWQNPVSGKLEIVDGSQRIRTIAAFLKDELTLHNLKVLSELNGFKFSDLLESRRLKFQDKSVRGIILNEKTDPDARFELFDRINTGSKNANSAEIRRGALPGPFIDLVAKLAKDPIFVALTPVTEKQLKEREREELVTRFFAYSEGLDNYKDDVSNFLFNYCREKNKQLIDNPGALSNLKTDFMMTMNFIRNAFPLGFRKRESSKTTPRARFESIAIGSFMALKKKPELDSKPIQNSEWSTSEDFLEVTGSDGANSIKRLRDRIDFTTTRLLNDYD